MRKLYPISASHKLRYGLHRRHPEQYLRKQNNELKQRVKALELIRKDYNEVMQHATEIIFKMDSQGNFFFASAEFERGLGYTGEELAGKHFTTIVYPDDLEICLQSFSELLQFGKAPANVNIRVKHVNGDYKWVNCSAVCLFDEHQKPSHCIGFAHDISELVKSQDLLDIENKRYLEATRAGARAVVDAQEKERADIGYELHDNVNQILSTAKLYLDLAKNNENDRLSLIARSADNITNAVNEIRKISKSLVPGSINDLGLVASIEDLVENVRLTKTLSVEFCHQGDIETVINPKGKLMLFRIIQEQVTNVMKHSGASKLVIELVLDRDSIYLSISDNGKGFDKEAIKAKKGVGLYNIANRAELFNGTINMVTSPGKGCQLNVRIPV